MKVSKIVVGMPLEVKFVVLLYITLKNVKNFELRYLHRFLLNYVKFRFKLYYFLSFRSWYVWILLSCSYL